MNATTEKSYNGYTPGYCCSCSGTGTFQRQYGTGSAVSGACFRCSGTGYVSERDAKRNRIHDTAGMGGGAAASGEVDNSATVYGSVTFAGATMMASKSTGQVRITGKRGQIIVCDDGDVFCSDGIPKARHAELSQLALVAATTFKAR